MIDVRAGAACRYCRRSQQQQEEGVSAGIHALACFSLATWRPACFETGRCCPVRLCGLVACYERCVHKGRRGKSCAERGRTNDRSSHTVVVTHGRQTGRWMLFSRYLHQHVDVRRGAEIRCSPTASLAPAPQKKTPHEDPAGFRTRPTTTTDTPFPVCSRRSLMRLGVCTSVTHQRFASWVMSRSPAGDGPFLDPAERDDSRHVGTPRC